MIELIRVVLARRTTGMTSWLRRNALGDGVVRADNGQDK
jgi:hypothetical protein